MKINIEIDVTPAELRHFLGLPDVAGLQEDMIEYVRGRVSRGAENFDPAELLRESTAWGNKTLQRILNMAASRMGAEDIPPDPDDTRDQGSSGAKSSKRSSGSGKSSSGKSGSTNKSSSTKKSSGSS